MNNLVKKSPLFLFLFLFSQCCKEKDIPTNDYRLWSKGACLKYYQILDKNLINKPIWASDYVDNHLLTDSTFHLNISTHYLSGVTFESILIRNIPLKLGRYNITKTGDIFQSKEIGSTYLVLRDNSGVESSIKHYKFIPTDYDKVNNITVTYINKDTNYMEGTFDLSYYESEAQDTLLLRNGTFVAAYPKKL